ncbi:WYL domain-containing protein [Rathayibacter sp. VKM Ac-2804]|uniref:helix-turn-helix transcriptional regulator n=1 Tax=unclassified Rathayibacter TaxID=2609250 RepID=UPI00132EBBDC|nr:MULTISPECIES: YafY family protein [unclassified Rathayibacter]NRG42978.1 YafY family transcriptional regulator [Rathayibacter sp. VKM Ac-2835]QHF24870.1 WYL domain-containing protein [Rathayibacter sp. VKM Ac-2804]
MAATTSRALALLDLLQTHRQWSGPVLAARLGVTERTLRRDVERLRELGYTVAATRGALGGYRLEAGTRVPPLLLSDDEAVAVAVGLRLAADEGLADGERTTLSALAKFEQVLPGALRERVNAVGGVLRSVRPRTASIPPEILGRIALACRDHERLRFHYVAADGAETDRVVEPHAVVSTRRTWVLVGWDRQREDWRTFRLDRVSRLLETRVHFEPRRLPEDGAAAFAASTGRTTRYELTVDLALPLEEMVRVFGRWSAGAAALDGRWTRWPVEAETVAGLLAALVWIPEGVEHRIEGDPGTRAAVRAALERMHAAASR